jgi:FKBP-type peptidyl-prolyl cis-trans isomerase 2
MAAEKPPRILFAILVALVLIAAGGGAALLYEYNKPKSAHTILTVQVGDNVTVNYIGAFGSGAQAGRVFDTSIYSVATQNISYPKSLEYQSRGPPSAYSPLGVHVGPSGSYTIGGVTFGPVVTGFWQGLIGLPVNQTRTIDIPPSLAYGAMNSSCLLSAPLVERVATFSSVSASDFSTLFPNVTATVGVVFSDPTFGWNDTVFAVNSTSVVVQALASVGQTALPNGLPFSVSSVNSTTIVLSSQLTPSDAGLVLGHVSGNGLCGTTKFIVSAVNLATETFTENFNAEVKGETLDFTVTVVQILSP